MNKPSLPTLPTSPTLPTIPTLPTLPTFQISLKHRTQIAHRWSIFFYIVKSLNSPIRALFTSSNALTKHNLFIYFYYIILTYSIFEKYCWIFLYFLQTETPKSHFSTVVPKFSACSSKAKNLFLKCIKDKLLFSHIIWPEVNPLQCVSCWLYAKVG
jgi:hypothetical protein